MLCTQLFSATAEAEQQTEAIDIAVHTFHSHQRMGKQGENQIPVFLSIQITGHQQAIKTTVQPFLSYNVKSQQCCSYLTIGL